MDLSTTQQILLIILSSALAVFLVVAIIIGILAIRLLITIRLITTKAEKLIETAEAAAEVFKKASGPVGIFSVVKNAIELFQQHKKHK